MSLKFVIADITKLNVEAIVNAANRTLLGGGGVDGAIHRAAGPRLLEYCKTLGGAKTTQAKITPGFDLKAKHIIHAVGPVYRDGTYREDEMLYKTYQNALNVAKEHGIKEIAFPLISAGAYRFPKQLAIEIAVKAIQDFLENNEMNVILVFYDGISLDVKEDNSLELMKLITTNIDDSILDR